MNSCFSKLSCLVWVSLLALLVSQASWAQQQAVDSTAGSAEAAPVATEVPVQPTMTQVPTQLGSQARGGVCADPDDKRILGVLPNYRTAPHSDDYRPINWKCKLKIAAKDSFDWPSYVTGAAFAGLYMIDKDHPAFGEGVAGFARYYGTSTADQVIGNMLTEGFMSAAFREDPRYFRMEKGPVMHRLGYAVTRVLVFKTDHGNPTLNLAEIVGNSAGASISNLYYPDQRGLGPTATRAGTQIATDAISNVAKEFWPDIKRHWHHKPADPQAATQSH